MPGTGDSKMRAFARRISRQFGGMQNNASVRALDPVHRKINERAEMQEEISRYGRLLTERGDLDAETGQVRMGFIIDSTDCDHTNSVYGRVELFQSATELRDWIDSRYEDAEGPISVRIVPVQEALEFEARTRDYGLEAFENGHPHSIRYE